MYSKRACAMGGSRGGGAGGPDPPEKSQKYRVPDPLKNHKATKPAFKFGPLSARQRNAIKWRSAGGPMIVDGPLLVAFGSSLPHYPK